MLHFVDVLVRTGQIKGPYGRREATITLAG